MTSEQEALLAKLPRTEDGPLHLMSVLINHPELLRRWGRLTEILFTGAVDPRSREILVLRTAHNVGSRYEWANHVALGIDAGLSAEEIEALGRADPGTGWRNADLALIRAADELHADNQLTRDGWERLSRDRRPDELIEIIFIVGAYHVVQYWVGAFGVIPDAGPNLGLAA